MYKKTCNVNNDKIQKKNDKERLKRQEVVSSGRKLVVYFSPGELRWTATIVGRKTTKKEGVCKGEKGLKLGLGWKGGGQRTANSRATNPWAK